MSKTVHSWTKSSRRGSNMDKYGERRCYADLVALYGEHAANEALKVAKTVTNLPHTDDLEHFPIPTNYEEKAEALWPITQEHEVHINALKYNPKWGGEPLVDTQPFTKFEDGSDSIVYADGYEVFVQSTPASDPDDPGDFEINDSKEFKTLKCAEKYAAELEEKLGLCERA